MRAKHNVSGKELKALLRRAGHKITPVRVAVLEIMEKSRKPLSTQEIIEYMGDRFNEATIYRTIKTLKSSEIIRQIDLRHNHAHYERVRSDHHHHITCQQCGTITDVACETEELEEQILRSSHFAKIEQHALEFFGICASCGKNKCDL